MTIFDWLLLLFAAAFTLVMLFTLIAYVARLFRHARPEQKNTGKRKRRKT